MDPRLYKAAMNGDVNFIRRHVNCIESQVTPNKNTVLHVASMFGRAKCVKEILGHCSGPLFRAVNARGESSLHISAREGHSNIVRALIDHAKALDEDIEDGVGVTKEMLRMTNVDGDMALHEAVRNKILDVVDMLTKEDPGFSHVANMAEETPLYLAAERSYCDILFTILKNCNTPAYSGPHGRTALHAAAIWDSKECVQMLCNWKPPLTKEADVHGWTPLHYAARFGYASRVRQLLHFDASVAYLAADGDDNKTALHVATSHGCINVMKEILSHCPDCWEITNSKGQNILHIAVEIDNTLVILFILSTISCRSFINQKDIDENTPLHLFAASDFLDSRLIGYFKGDKMAYNKENFTPLDVAANTDISAQYGVDELRIRGARRGRRNIIREDTERVTKWKKERAEVKKKLPLDITKFVDNHLIVAALIATVTFAAGFTVPGGYNNNDGPNQGMAVLTRNAAFKAFVVSNTIAMVCSITAVFIHFKSSWFRYRPQMDSYKLALGHILIAMAAMVVAFLTGLCAVLAHSLSLAIAIFIIGCVFFFRFFVVLRAFIVRYYKMFSRGAMME